MTRLALSLRLAVYSPGDYVCRQGDVGREMYIIGRGRLVVVAHDGRRNFASLTDGDYFGEVEHRLSRRRYKLSGVQTKLGFGLELGLGAGGCALGGSSCLEGYCSGVCARFK